MNPTATKDTPARRPLRSGADDPVARRAHAVRRDPTTPAEPDPAPRGDDRSHTPPHGEALLPPRRP